MRRRDQRGIALMTALIVSALLVVVAAATIAILTSGSHGSLQDSNQGQALDIAEGGLDWAVANFSASSPDQIVTNDVPLGAGVYTIAAPSALPGGRYLLTVYAYVPNASTPTSQRALQAIIAKINGAWGNYAVLAGGGLTMTGNAETTSTPSAGLGNVHTNGSLTLSGSNVVVDGSAEAADGISNSGGTIAGNQNPNASTLPIPNYTSSQLQSFLSQAQAAGTTPIESYSGGNLSGYYSSTNSSYDPTQNPPASPPDSISISGGNVEVSGTVYIAGNLSISGRTTISGGGTLIVDGTISMSGQGTINATDSANPVALVSLAAPSSGDAITLSGKAQAGGAAAFSNVLVFAPNGDVKVTGNGNLQGEVISGGATTTTDNLNGNAEVVRNTNMSLNNLGLANWTLTSWEDATQRLLSKGMVRGGI